MAPTREAIKAELEKLAALRGNIRSTSMFGNDNDAALAAQIQVLEGLMDEDDIWDEWPEDDDDMYVRDSALAAYNWMMGTADEDDRSPAESWEPLRIKGD